jgi:hypothetical protein
MVSPRAAAKIPNSLSLLLIPSICRDAGNESRVELLSQIRPGFHRTRFELFVFSFASGFLFALSRWLQPRSVTIVK